MQHYELTGPALQSLLETLQRYEADPYQSVYKLSISAREDGIAVKVNEGTWSPTVGEVRQ